MSAAAGTDAYDSILSCRLGRALPVKRDRRPPVVEFVNHKGGRMGDPATTSVGPSAASESALASRGEGEVSALASGGEREASA